MAGEKSHPNGSGDAPDLREHGAPVKGRPQTSDRRLFMQLQVFTGCVDPALLAQALRRSGIESALYLDVNDPTGVGVLFIVEMPELLTGKVRSLLTSEPFAGLRRRPEFTMLGRTYSSGREPNLEFWLLEKPRQTALNSAWPWAVWYPLRRTPDFALLPPEEQGRVLQEHAQIGMAWGRADHAHDIRLACHGLDADDNEFVIGLVSKDLHPLSRIVQEMRRTTQTARYIRSLGPFFVGRALWQSPMPA